MAELKWHDQDSRRYISGVSNGVFYTDDGKGVPWNGLISVTEKSQVNEPTPVHNSLGQKYDLHGNVAEKRHSIVCYTYPEEMDEYLGFEYLDEYGFMVDERPPKKFNMVYRNECDGYYELHILLGQIATFGDKAHTTDGVNVGVSTITLNLQGVPHEVYGSSHLILDSRNPITASAERFLYGTRHVDANFNDFLNAEVEWVTQVINYAPTIEPDYDNRVWLGRENLVSNSVWSLLNTSTSSVKWEETDLETEYGNPVVRFTKLLESGTPGFYLGRVYPEVGDFVSTWVDYKITNGNVTPYIRLLGGPDMLMSDTIELPNGLTRYYRISKKVTEDDVNANLGIQIYATSSEVGASFDLYDFKAEIGYGGTPWTPSLGSQEGGYNPPTNPYPPNYVPGVKNSSKWNSTNVVPYWDEVAEQLALHSVSPEEWTQSKLSIPLDVSTPIDLKTSANINFGVDVSEEVGENLISGTTDEPEIIVFTSRMSYHQIHTDIQYEVGQEYTFSVFVDKISDDDVPINVRVGIGRGDNFITSIAPEVLVVPGVRTEVTFTPNKFQMVSGTYFVWQITNDRKATTVGYRNAKLEYGSTATAWTPDPVHALHRRIIGTREPQVLSEQAPNVIGSQTVTLNSTVSDNPHLDIYHNGPAGSDDVRVDNLMVVLQSYQGGFFDGNTVPKTRGERYRRVDCETGYHTVYEHLQFVNQSEIELRTIGPDLYELTGPATHLQPSSDGDHFTFIGPQATMIDDNVFEIDDNQLGF